MFIISYVNVTTDQVLLFKIRAIRVRNTEYRCKIQLVLLLAAAAGYRRYGGFTYKQEKESLEMSNSF